MEQSRRGPDAWFFDPIHLRSSGAVELARFVRAQLAGVSGGARAARARDARPLPAGQRRRVPSGPPTDRHPVPAGTLSRPWRSTVLAEHGRPTATPCSGRSVRDASSASWWPDRRPRGSPRCRRGPGNRGRRLRPGPHRCRRLRAAGCHAGWRSSRLGRRRPWPPCRSGRWANLPAVERPDRRTGRTAGLGRARLHPGLTSLDPWLWLAMHRFGSHPPRGDTTSDSQNRNGAPLHRFGSHPPRQDRRRPRNRSPGSSARSGSGHRWAAGNVLAVRIVRCLAGLLLVAAGAAAAVGLPAPRAAAAAARS